MSCFGGVALPLFKGHTGVVRCVDVSPDGGRVVTCSDDRTARINDAVSGKNIAVLAGQVDGDWDELLSCGKRC